MSFDLNKSAKEIEELSLNPFGTRQCLSTHTNYSTAFQIRESQSLWNRAMSFDLLWRPYLWQICVVSIPLEQGNVFRRRRYHQRVKQTQVSIPLEQGNVFRQ